METLGYPASFVGRSFQRPSSLSPFACPPGWASAGDWHGLLLDSVRPVQNPEHGRNPCPAGARQAPIELGWARRMPAIGAARKPEGPEVSLLRLAKAASAHPPPINYGCRSEQPGVPGAASGGVSQSRSIAPTTRTRSALATTATGRTGPCAAANQGRELGVANQPFSASQAARSAGPWKSSRASARASNFSTGRAWIWAVVVSLKGPQRRLRRRRVTLAASWALPSWSPPGGLWLRPPGGPQQASLVPPWCGGSPQGESRRSP